MCELFPVSFHGDTIFVATIQEQPYTAMKPIVENLGLGWASQSQKLNANKKRWGVTIIVIPSEGGEQEMLCLPVRKLPAYLASINPNKVREELRPKIELYQNESDDALWNYWMNGRAERQTAHSANSPITPDQEEIMRAIIRAKLAPFAHKNHGRYMRNFSAVWEDFERHFCIEKFSLLPQSRMIEAVEYLTSLEIAAKPNQESPKSAGQKKIEPANSRKALPQAHVDIEEIICREVPNIRKLNCELCMALINMRGRIMGSLYHSKENLSELERSFCGCVNGAIANITMTVGCGIDSLEKILTANSLAQQILRG